jgi:hypothetical protein
MMSMKKTIPSFSHPPSHLPARLAEASAKRAGRQERPRACPWGSIVVTPRASRDNPIIETVEKVVVNANSRESNANMREFTDDDSR